MVSGHQEPAFTVASLATTTAIRPSMRPSPVTTPAAGACPLYWSYAISSPISRKNESGSSSFAIRSRAVSFPAQCCRSMRAPPPPSRRRSSSLRNCSTRRRMCAWRATSTLFELRKIGRIHEDAIHVLHDLAVGFGIGGDLLPLRVGAEFAPVLVGGRAAGMGQYVDQGGLRFLRVLRHPVADAL